SRSNGCRDRRPGAGANGDDRTRRRGKTMSFRGCRPSGLPFRGCRPSGLPLSLLLALLALAPARPDAQAPATPRHRELFPPEDLGLLEAPDRAAWQKPDQILDALGIADGAKVADIGAGAGWFTMRLARRVGPNGTVYAQDVQPQMLAAIKRRVQSEGLR